MLQSAPRSTTVTSANTNISLKADAKSEMLAAVFRTFHQDTPKSDAELAAIAEQFCLPDCVIDATCANTTGHQLMQSFSGHEGFVELVRLWHGFELENWQVTYSSLSAEVVFTEVSYTPRCKATGKSGTALKDMHKWTFRDGKLLSGKVMWGNPDMFTTISQPCLSTSCEVVVGTPWSGGHRDWPLVVVSSYTKFDNLAHGPRGTEASHSAWTYRLNPTNGQLTLLAVNNDAMNPAFSRVHPTKNVIYACTESIETNGDIVSWSICPTSGELTKMGCADAQGTSTCYVTIDKSGRNAIVVNYWNATIVVLAIDEDTGVIGQTRCVYDPNEGRAMAVSSKKHVNHSKNDKSAQAERQLDPHSHSAILDPIFSKIVFVPDLGMDLIRQLLFDDVAGTITPIATIPSGSAGKTALGPRYIEFHPTLPMAYVINELSSEVAVFKFDVEIARRVIATGVNESVLQLVQMISTIPTAFPQSMNTCGRLTVHASGSHVLVSNRGHDSIAVFKVIKTGDDAGYLTVATIQHTRGKCPRHFQFDGSGQWMIAANQDSDGIVSFHFNLCTGEIAFTGNDYRVPSPNFVCFMEPRHAQHE
eukprot:m.174866 g.174866  ORF g.174866 m.174866 type:complete len:589 (-) comp31788_c0_seq1:71-1837(-)